MTSRFVLIAGAAGLLATTAFAADAVGGVSSGQRAIQSSSRAIAPPTQQRGSAPQDLRTAPATGNPSSGISSVGSSSRSRGAMSQRRQRFESDSSSSLSDTIEQRRKRFESGS